MANLQEDYQWPNGIYQWEEADPITGGPGGIDNVPPRQLASRTQFLAIAALIAQDFAAMGVKEAHKTARQRMQEGVVAIYNRGMLSGCAASKAASGRKVALAAGGVFAQGRMLPCLGDQVGISVPSNNGGTTLTYNGYLSVAANGSLSFLITDAGASVPPDGIPICRITVPAGNTAGDLNGVTVTDTRRQETSYPTLVNTMPNASIALKFNMIDTNYAVLLDVVSYSGGWNQRPGVYSGDKAANGFKIYADGTLDAVTVRWLAVKLSL